MTPHPARKDEGGGPSAQPAGLRTRSDLSSSLRTERKLLVFGFPGLLAGGMKPVTVVRLCKAIKAMFNLAKRRSPNPQ